MGPRYPRPARRGHTACAALALGLTLMLFVGLPVAATAGGVGTWTNVSGATGTSLTQAGLVTTPDGLLHVAWSRASATTGKKDLMHRTIRANGTFGASQTVESLWSRVNDPAMVFDPFDGRVYIVFSGTRGKTLPTDIYKGLTYTSSPDGGASWTLNSGPINPTDLASSSSPVSAIGTSNALFTSWYGTSGVWVHRGVSAATPAYNYQSGLGSSGYYSNLGLEKGGQLWLVWASNGTKGLYAQMVDQTSGGPSGTRYKLPSSTTTYLGAEEFSMKNGRVPTTGRPKGGGVFVAYPSGYPGATKVRLWKITAAKRTTMVVAGGTTKKYATAIAAAPDGRVWVAWSQLTSGRPQVFVRRSNTSATRFGPTKAYTVPSGYGVVWNLAAAVRNGKLDVLAHLGGSGKAHATFHIQFKPPT